MQTYRCVSPLLDGTVQEAPPASNRDPELLIRADSRHERLHPPKAGWHTSPARF
jgi:hypothetical protein